MVKIDQSLIKPTVWLQSLLETKSDRAAMLLSAKNLISSKLSLYLEAGATLAFILNQLEVDEETLGICLLYPAFKAGAIDSETVLEKFGLKINQVLQDVMMMQSLHELERMQNKNPGQIENLRKMLLAMVTDVRAVLIFLAEQLVLLRDAKTLENKAQKKLAETCLRIYTPLANRLGVWKIKWEMEDLCFRYLDPITYKEIAKGLALKRLERESHLTKIKKELNDILRDAKINQFELFGRTKHIYSIYQKMKRKNLALSEIYDVTALRILVGSLTDCYTALSVLQERFTSLPREFDDYIAQPKKNGYQSIHTVILDDDERFVEVQIRTHEMHKLAETGVAAHWGYKEGIAQTKTEGSKIELLRAIMAWQKEVSENIAPNHTHQDIFADRVYVFTPANDVIDMQQGATPLDFAYHIHSEVGHRCRGAKVNNKMVTLTYALKTGDKVDILTAKQTKPSRDWLREDMGFIKTSRARAKINQWFHAHDANKKADAPKITKPAAPRRNTAFRKIETPDAFLPDKKIHVAGLSNVLTQMAKCCNPLSGEAVKGFITHKKIIKIHKRHCRNIAKVKISAPDRLLNVSWGEKK